MSKRVQLRRGTTAENNTFTGAVGEVTVDTDKKTLVVHDGVTVGGTPLTRVSEVVSLIPVELMYAPIAYPKSTPPAGYLVMMGQSISQAVYPILYSLYGATLPDLRGQFLRGLDYGRGIDVGRVVLSEQEDAIKAHTHSAPTRGSAPVAPTGQWPERGVNSGSTGSTGGDETRPKNIAFLYIVKAG